MLGVASAIRVASLAKAADHGVESLVGWREHLTKGPKESPLRGPICDGKYHISKRSVKIVLDRMPKVERCAPGIVAKGPTAPCPENKRRMSVGSCNVQHAMNPSS
jgi:hypothetical protein